MQKYLKRKGIGHQWWSFFFTCIERGRLENEQKVQRSLNHLFYDLRKKKFKNVLLSNNTLSIFNTKATPQEAQKKCRTRETATGATG